MTRDRRLWILIAIVTTASVTPAAAQDAPTIELAFARAALQYKRDLRDLLATRGIRSLPEAEDLTVQRVAELLGTEYDSDVVGLLFYAHDGRGLWTWLLSQRGLLAAVHQDVSRAGVESAINALRSALRLSELQQARTPQMRGIGAAAPVRSGNPPTLADATARLTTLLLPPRVAGALKGIRKLIVVPTLGIGTVPFAMLQPVGPESYLVDSVSIAVASSLYDAFQLVRKWGDETGPVSAVVVGNPSFGSNLRWTLPPLPGAEEEAKQVSRVFGTVALTGRSASKRDVLETIARSGARYRSRPILYFATHGVADPDDPLNGSFLALAPDSGSGGEWTAAEIQRTELRGFELAVLSACQTGLGRVHDAGVIGLARAFQLAGIPRVVTTLWNVDDAATAVFMAEFSREILSDSPNNALQSTIRRMRKRDPDPRHWAPFVLFGSVW